VSDSGSEGWVERALHSVSPGVRARFASAPEATLRSDFAVAVAAVDHLTKQRADGGACDGMSYLDDGVILYAPTPNSRRQNFTLAHELGHSLIESVDGIYDWLATQDEPGRLLESLCDRIAQRLLLPPGVAKVLVGDGPVGAHHVQQLYDTTEASRPVCAIALTELIPGLGAIAILDRSTARVTHASVHPDPELGWPRAFPWRGQALADSHPLLMLAPGDQSTRRMVWRTPWGAEGDYYVDAVADVRRVVAVFSAHDLWGVESFHAPVDRDFDDRPLLKGFCCGIPFERRGYPCSACRQPYCPRCDRCRCERADAREVTCRGCWLKYAPHLVVGDLCVECRG
jgi:hypothetical protein